MSTIKQVIRYDVAGQSFTSWQAAEDYLRDQFGEEIHELIKVHFPVFAHRQACIDFVLDMWKGRDMWVKLLSVTRDYNEDVNNDEL